jgi:hypothetical protein
VKKTDLVGSCSMIFSFCWGGLAIKVCYLRVGVRFCVSYILEYLVRADYHFDEGD